MELWLLDGNKMYDPYSLLIGIAIGFGLASIFWSLILEERRKNG